MVVIVPILTLVVSLSSHGASASPVAMTLRMSYQMQCGWPGARIEVVFPSEERLPARLRRTAVLVDGLPAAAVAHSGRTVVVSVPRPSGVQCDVMAPGVATISFTRAAGLGNPRRPGSYVVTARRGQTVLRGSFTVR